MTTTPSLPPLEGGSTTPPLVNKAKTPETPVRGPATPPPPPKTPELPPLDDGSTTPPLNPPAAAKREPGMDRDLLTSPCTYEALAAEIDIEQHDIPEDDAELERETQLRLKKKRFQRLIRLIVANKLWQAEATENTQEGDGAFQRDCGEKLTFNINAYKSNVQACGKLSPESKTILSKPSCMRNEEEIKVVQKILYRLKCFDRYSLQVKQGLARVIDYDKFEDGRLIVRQGHLGCSFYFIVSGAVIVDRREYDPFVKEFYNLRVAELTAGDCFGELALLHNTKRTASIRCRGTSEFLRVDKPDFDEVLRNCHQREWEIRINLLSSHQVFSGWNNRELKMANAHSKMKTYPPNTVIVSCDLQLPDRVFFIVSGSCVVGRRLEITKRMVSRTKYRYVLPPLKVKTTEPHDLEQTTGSRKELDESWFVQDTSTTETKTSKEKVKKETKSKGKKEYPKDIPETRFFSVAELKENDYFNVGEDLDGLYVISLGRVEVVQISKLAFSRHSSGRLLDELRKKYTDFLPSGQKAFEKYVTDKRWECYKKTTVQNATKKPRMNYHVSPRDVPGIISADQIYYCHKADII